MDVFKIIAISLGCVFLIAFFIDAKIRMYSIFGSLKALFVKYKDGKENGISIVSIFTFAILPFAFSFFLYFSFGIHMNSKTTELVLAFFSIVFTILFGSITLINANKTKENTIKREVISQTFHFVVWLLVLSLFLIIMLIVYTFVLNDECTELSWVYQLFSSAITAFGLHVISVMFVVIKRTLRLFESEE